MRFACYLGWVVGAGLATIVAVSLPGGAGGEFGLATPASADTGLAAPAVPRDAVVAVGITRPSRHENVFIRFEPRPDATDSGAHEPASGLVVTLDAQGRPAEPDRASKDWQALRARMDATTRTTAGAGKAVPAPGGGVMIYVGNTLKRYTVAAIGSDDTVTHKCVRASHVAKHTPNGMAEPAGLREGSHSPDRVAGEARSRGAASSGEAQ